MLLFHVVCVCLSLIRPAYTGGTGGTLVSGCFLKNEFDGGLTCVGFCMEMYGKGVYSHCVYEGNEVNVIDNCGRGLQICRGGGLNALLNETVSKSIGNENGIVLPSKSEALRL